MKIERLLFILLALLTRQKIVAKDVADKFQVSTRTIYRDIDTLSLAGIPIYSERGNEGGFYIDKHYKLDASLFTDAEQQLIFNLIQNIKRKVPTPFYESLENKVFYHGDMNDSVGTHYFDLRTCEMDKKYLLDLTSAIERQRIIQFRYYAQNGQRTNRTVYPQHLVYKMNSWYLLGLCLEKQDFRFFKLTRMKDLEILDQEFNKDSLFQLTLTSIEKKIDPVISKPKQKVVLEGKLDALPFLYDIFTDQELSILSDKILIKAERWLDSLFIQKLIGLGSKITIVEPEELKIEVIDELQKMLNKYDI